MDSDTEVKPTAYKTFLEVTRKKISLTEILDYNEILRVLFNGATGQNIPIRKYSCSVSSI